MNETAVEHLSVLQSQIERADMLSIQTVTWGFIQEALGLVSKTAKISESSYRATAACAHFRDEMEKIGYRPSTEEVERCRSTAIQALAELRALISTALPSRKAEILRIP